MTCTNCINKGRMCLSCEDGKFYAPPKQRQKRQLTAWEKRWNKWAKEAR